MLIMSSLSNGILWSFDVSATRSAPPRSRPEQSPVTGWRQRTGRMTSSKQTRANRENAKRSTGPRTDAGKASSSKNAMRHGLLSEASTLPDEDPAEFDAHAAAIKRDLEPVGGLEE